MFPFLTSTGMRACIVSLEKGEPTAGCGEKWKRVFCWRRARRERVAAFWRMRERELESEVGAEEEEGEGKRGWSMWRKEAWRVLSEEMRSAGGVVKVEMRLKREVF